MDFLNSITLLLTKLTISTCFKNLDIMLFHEWTLFVYRPKFHTDLGQKETAKTLVHHGQDFKSSNLNNDY